ncbi:MAG: WD40/YVTN/BNR-like repeat-containing protein [Acidobacteriota bacterium]|jgi:hypothetical protein|nr:hypothetical protein [Bryobacteraceae bacterium CoA2 C42]
MRAVSVRFVGLAAFFAVTAWGQAPAAPTPAPLSYAGKPLRVEAVCTEDDIQSLGLGCTVAQPCPVYLELSALDTGANRILVAGNLHTETATLASVLLASEDGGTSWTEAHPRIQNGSLDQVHFFDLQTGWVSGQIVGALARDPFLLLTTDGGKTWRQRAVLSEPGPGSIEQFGFESATAGTVLVDRGPGAEGGRYAVLETRTGGESWSIRSVGRAKPALALRPAANAAWRLRAHAPTRSYRVERKEASGKWNPVASFLVNAGQCKPEDTELREPPPEPTAGAAPTDAVAVFQVGTPKDAKKTTPKKKP